MRGSVYAEVIHQWLPVLWLGLVLLLTCEVTLLQYVVETKITKRSITGSTLLC